MYIFIMLYCEYSKSLTNHCFIASTRIQAGIMQRTLAILVLLRPCFHHVNWASDWSWQAVYPAGRAMLIFSAKYSPPIYRIGTSISSSLSCRFMQLMGVSFMDLNNCYLEESIWQPETRQSLLGCKPNWRH